MGDVLKAKHALWEYVCAVSASKLIMSQQRLMQGDKSYEVHDRQPPDKIKKDKTASRKAINRNINSHNERVKVGFITWSRRYWNVPTACITFQFTLDSLASLLLMSAEDREGTFLRNVGIAVHTATSPPSPPSKNPRLRRCPLFEELDSLSGYVTHDHRMPSAQTHNELWEGRVASVRSVCSTTKMIRINPFVATNEPSWLQTQDTSFLLQISSSIIYSLALSWHSKPTTCGFYLRRPKFSK